LIARAWEEQKQVKEIMLFLHSHAVSTNLAIKIYKQYGDKALQVVQSDPYRLARDILGVGFKTADRIAQSLGLPSDHPSRIEAGLIYALNQMTDEGHVFSPRQELADNAVELLGEIALDLVPLAIENLSREDRVHIDTVPLAEGEAHSGESPDSLRESAADYRIPAIYLASLYHCETSVAELLRQLALAMPSNLSDLPPDFISLDPKLTEEQQLAIRTTLSHPVSVLTGGPGTGKTTALQALIAIMESTRKSYALASPTGRAAKRLSEATGQPAKTIHRLLGYSPREGFKQNAKDPLPVDLLVVDEVSMLDLVLANHLLKALRPGSHLLLVGDVDQLPSVGAGDVLSPRRRIENKTAALMTSSYSRLRLLRKPVNGLKKSYAGAYLPGSGSILSIRSRYWLPCTAVSPEWML
jgi:exodeoxyribonuclease V alpha subunit